MAAKNRHLHGFAPMRIMFRFSAKLNRHMAFFTEDGGTRDHLFRLFFGAHGEPPDPIRRWSWNDALISNRDS